MPLSQFIAQSREQRLASQSFGSDAMPAPRPIASGASAESVAGIAEGAHPSAAPKASSEQDDDVEVAVSLMLWLQCAWTSCPVGSLPARTPRSLALAMTADGIVTLGDLQGVSANECGNSTLSPLVSEDLRGPSVGYHAAVAGGPATTSPGTKHSPPRAGGQAGENR